ncbi:hypothetical protein FRB96_005905 [Tulasnella sp. 330]|nr:hypothetical protein FRB96_005905 [Tulasnella sp. 330]KAG8882594.1 hypothetical protein FRB98_003570 [Tulasnella sp. 332]KAG8882836.1 hypothetical protein FRB97_007660 [Tulasnella sp. 331]
MKPFSYSPGFAAVFVAVVVAVKDSTNSAGNTLATPCPYLPSADAPSGVYNITGASHQHYQINFYAASTAWCYYNTIDLKKPTVALTTVTSRKSTKKPAQFTPQDKIWEATDDYGSRYWILTERPAMLSLGKTKLWVSLDGTTCDKAAEKIYDTIAYVMSDLIAKSLSDDWAQQNAAANAKGMALADPDGSIKFGHGVQSYKGWLEQLSAPSATCYWKDVAH